MTPSLVTELHRQQVPTPSRERHLAMLGQGDAEVVVTGQQVGLFLGPGYSFYKAATAIAIARRRGGIPIFWLQSEDHDAAEVASCAVLNDEGHRVCIHLEPTGAARASMADRQLGDAVGEALQQLDAALEDAPHRAPVMDLLRRHYRPETGWVAAFGGALGEVFADEGLLLFDPRTPAVAELAAEVHRRAFEASAEMDAALQAGALRLEKSAAGVAPRPGVSLSFFHRELARGSRFRLERVHSGWCVPGSDDVLSAAAISALLDEAPLRFSTSSLLRVVLQQELFSPCAQVAGPGEARYLEQMPPLCALFGVPSPSVVPRARVVMTTAPCRRRLAALDIGAADVSAAPTLLAQLAKGDDGPSGDDVCQQINDAFERAVRDFGGAVAQIDPSLEQAIDRTRRHIGRGAEKLGGRVDRARARRDDTRVARVDYLTRHLYPAGAPQERALSFPHFASRVGLAAFKQAVFDAVDVHLAEIEDGDGGRVHEVAL